METRAYGWQRVSGAGCSEFLICVHMALPLVVSSSIYTKGKMCGVTESVYFFLPGR